MFELAAVILRGASYASVVLSMSMVLLLGHLWVRNEACDWVAVSVLVFPKGGVVRGKVLFGVGEVEGGVDVPGGEMGAS